MTLILIAAALAQASSPAKDPNYPVEMARKEAERTMQLYADCLVKGRSNAAKIDAFLRAEPGTPAFSDQAHKLATPACAPRAQGGYKLRFQPVLLRSGLYDALYRREFRQPVEVGDRPALNHAAELNLAGRPAPDEFTFTRELGDCTVRRNVGAVHTLITAKAGTKSENAAFGVVMPDIRQCVREGNTLRFSRTMLRGLLGEAIYKLSKAPAAPPAAVGGAS